MTSHPRESAVFYRVPDDEYPTMVRASGFHLWDSSGKQYLDLSSGISATAGIGQGRPEIADAMAAQARTLTFVHNSRVTNDQQELLAARLAGLAPEGVGRVMFTSGGSEANELSIRIARQYHLARGDWERTRIVTLAPSYHGATVGALSMTGRWDINRAYEPHLMDTVKVPAPVNFRGPFAGLEGESLAERAAAALDAAIEATGPHTVSAVMVEPVSPSAGMAVPPASYWQKVRDICDRYGILLITDEIVTGAGRTGEFLAMEHFGVVADLSNLAKGLSGGYVPLGATLVKTRIVEEIAVQSRRLAEVHTFSGAPISCAVGVAVLDVIVREGLMEQAAKRGAFLRSLLEDELGDLPFVGEIRGIGLMQMVEYVRSRDSREKLPPESEVAASLSAAMYERGVVLNTLGSQSALVGDCTVFFPALTIGETDLEHGVRVLREVLEDQHGRW
ncbi:aspartate aminotransferase family protein [Candidatus Spongiisocius sp.]|uniref:aminotransferase family protein n=1 Tax=Candidatus Spongiisocius sp. TaxID=3101273 RepID=UPI003B5BA9F0